MASVEAGPVKSLPESFYTPFLSDIAKATVRSLLPLEATPGLLSLLAGKPNPTTFPFTSFSFTARAPPPEDGQAAREDIELTLSGAELAAALQYGPTGGMASLIDWLYDLQRTVHGRERGEGWALSVGGGSQDLLSKAIIALLNPGDAVLVQSPVYAGVIPLFHSLKCEQIEVEADADGISSESLRTILEGWPADRAKPKVLYTIPYGGNPTGATATLSRRREVLQLAREHNFLIMEDDPYFYLFYGPESSRAPSYFAMERADTSSAGHAVGRVLRFDSISKILSAGMRIGFASGPAPILRVIDLHTATANLQPASLTQAIAHKLLSAWGVDGFLQHTRDVSAFYRGKRDVFEVAMQRHLKGLAEWAPPQSGLFFWFKLLIPGADDDSARVVRTQAFEHGVLALPGTVFLPNGRKTAYVRAAFSFLGEEQVEEALRRLRATILDARAEAGAA